MFTTLFPCFQFVWVFFMLEIECKYKEARRDFIIYLIKSPFALAVFCRYLLESSNCSIMICSSMIRISRVMDSQTSHVCCPLAWIPSKLWFDMINPFHPDNNQITLKLSHCILNLNTVILLGWCNLWKWDKHSLTHTDTYTHTPYGYVFCCNTCTFTHTVGWQRFFFYSTLDFEFLAAIQICHIEVDCAKIRTHSLNK